VQDRQRRGAERVSSASYVRGVEVNADDIL
jgi:hypothetical protein